MKTITVDLAQFKQMSERIAELEQRDREMTDNPITFGDRLRALVEESGGGMLSAPVFGTDQATQALVLVCDALLKRIEALEAEVEKLRA